VIKTAVARRYAKALCELVDAASVEATRVGLNELARIVSESSSLKHVLASPAFGFEEKREVLAALSRRLQCPPIFSDFLAQLVKKNRAGFLKEIAEEFTALANQQKGIKQVAVASARGMSPAEQESLRARLRDLLRHEINMTFHVEPSLLSGLSIRIGSMIFDSTVRGRLTAMRALVAKE
jgi:F-type H+-transporting ATPase subunit delta